MIEMVFDSMVSFFKGKLFRDYLMVFRQVIIGMVLGAALIVALAKAGILLIGSVIVSSFLTGMLGPWLFRNLKYA